MTLLNVMGRDYGDTRVVANTGRISNGHAYCVQVPLEGGYRTAAYGTAEECEAFRTCLLALPKAHEKAMKLVLEKARKAAKKNAMPPGLGALVDQLNTGKPKGMPGPLPTFANGHAELDSIAPASVAF